MTAPVTTPPAVGAPTPVRFPPIVRTRLDNGLGVWVIERRQMPVAVVMLVIEHGTASDPAGLPGLTGLTADLMDEGAGGRDAIALADVLTRLGAHLSTEVGADVTTFAATTLSRTLPDVLAVLGDVVARAHLAESDFVRVRELRQSRLRQMRRLSSATADRAFLRTLFGSHPYGHGALGTTASLASTTIDDVRAHYRRTIVPQASTLIVAGDVTAAQVAASAPAAFGGWEGADGEPASQMPPVPMAGPRVLLIDRPSAPQSELRVGHDAPSRRTPDYHELLVVDAILGGQFSSRINRNLREEKGLTYGARTSLGFRRTAGSLACLTSVDTERTAEAVGEVLREFEAIRSPGDVRAEELDLAKAALARGYVRNFETAGQLARAASQLVTFGLADDTFDRFVPLIESVTTDGVEAAAQRVVRPADAMVVVVGDAERCRAQLEAGGRTITVGTVEF